MNRCNLTPINDPSQSDADTAIPPTLTPSLSYSTHLALTVAFITVYLVLFLYVYVQLWLILYYKHKRRSYQTVFLFLCLLWAALRATLFAFYFSKTPLQDDVLTPFWTWFLYSLPVVLQFTTLVLLVAFFAQVVIKARSPENALKYKRLVRALCTLSVLVFLVVNITCGLMAQRFKKDNNCDSGKSVTYIAVRVAVNNSLFLAYGIALSYWIISLNRIANARALLESRGTTMMRAWCTCFFIILLYATRAIYNVLALALKSVLRENNYGWITVTDQADLVDLYDSWNYITYGVLLFLWEVLPTFIVTVFFRVQKPSQVPVTLEDMRRNSGTYRPQSFFDNPRQYETSSGTYQQSASSSFNGRVPAT